MSIRYERLLASTARRTRHNWMVLPSRPFCRGSPASAGCMHRRTSGLGSTALLLWKVIGVDLPWMKDIGRPRPTRRLPVVPLIRSTHAPAWCGATTSMIKRFSGHSNELSHVQASPSLRHHTLRGIPSRPPYCRAATTFARYKNYSVTPTFQPR